MQIARCGSVAEHMTSDEQVMGFNPIRVIGGVRKNIITKERNPLSVCSIVEVLHTPNKKLDLGFSPEIAAKIQASRFFFW